MSLRSATNRRDGNTNAEFLAYSLDLPLPLWSIGQEQAKYLTMSGAGRCQGLFRSRSVLFDVALCSRAFPGV